MIQPSLYDVIETLYPLPEDNLPSGSRGTLVEYLATDVFLVEFADGQGKTIALPSLRRIEFIVVWQAETELAVPLAEQVAQIVALMPQPIGTEILDFARFVTLRNNQAAILVT